MKNIIKSFITILILFTNYIEANTVDISGNNKILLLQNSLLYVDKKHTDIENIISNNLFEKHEGSIINIGLNKETIWLKFSLSNSTNYDIKKVLFLNSPILEKISLYNENRIKFPILKGTANLTKKHKTIFPSFNLTIPKNSSSTYYMKIESNYSPVSFSLILEDEKTFFQNNTNQQIENSLLIGFIVALMLYNLILGLYTKNKSYFFYSLYLFTLIYQQISYIGLLQIYLPIEVIKHDYYLALFKVASLIITSSLFAIFFLNTKKLKQIHNIYIFFIFISTAQIVLHYIFHLISLETVVLTSIVFIIYNISAAVIIYKNGNKQARLFIIGFGIVLFTYSMMILDTLSLSEFMQSYPNAVTWATALEALILSLAFADQYTILQKEKESVDKQIFEELKMREDIVQKEVLKKTAQLNKALHTKDLLLQEIHHRVKNNLQIILSIIRLQNDNIKDENSKKNFTSLEYRINAIAKTYNMLLLKEELQEINMKEYIDNLLTDIKGSIFNIKHKIEVETDIDVQLPLKQSVYIGLIINELVTNAYKYAFENRDGKITISLNKDLDNFILIIDEDGSGYDEEENNSSLGLKLIKVLVENQLLGSIEKSNNNTKNTIRFKI